MSGGYLVLANPSFDGWKMKTKAPHGSLCQPWFLPTETEERSRAAKSDAPGAPCGAGGKDLGVVRREGDLKRRRGLEGRGGGGEGGGGGDSLVTWGGASGLPARLGWRKEEQGDDM